MRGTCRLLVRRLPRPEVFPICTTCEVVKEEEEEEEEEEEDERAGESISAEFSSNAQATVRIATVPIPLKYNAWASPAALTRIFKHH